MGVDFHGEKTFEDDGQTSRLTDARALAGALLVVWLLVIGVGFFSLWSYAHRAGSHGDVQQVWPSGAAIQHATDRCTLVMFVHPRCPCSRASLSELERALTKCSLGFAAHVQFAAPAQVESDWTETDLWLQAQRIPIVQVGVDLGGVEARRFGAATSGHAMLYSEKGRLLFSGGLTSSRGHHGDNAGRLAVEALVRNGSALTQRVPVFGCPLVQGEAESHQDRSICCRK